MAGRMGGVWETSVKLEVVEVLPEENLLYVKGAVPGPAHGWVIVSETVRPLKRRPVRKAAPAKKSKDPLKAAKAAAKGGKK